MQVTYCLLAYRPQRLERHKGIGSLPSATKTARSARTAELPGCEMLVGIALYNPASATTVSRTSSTLFIGGVSFAHTSARGRSICPIALRERRDLWIIVDS